MDQTCSLCNAKGSNFAVETRMTGMGKQEFAFCPMCQELPKQQSADRTPAICAAYGHFTRQIVRSLSLRSAISVKTLK